MAPPRTQLAPEVEAQMRALAARGLGSKAIHARLAAAGCTASHRTIARRLEELRPGVQAERAAALAEAPVPVEPPEEAPPVPMAPDAGATLSAAERQVDALLARSPVWRRIQAAIASSLATHPDAAAAVARALREVTL